MTFIISPPDPNYGGSPSSYLDRLENGHRGPLRHFLIGHPRRIRIAIRNLHARGYVEYDQWTPLFHIRKGELIIRPTPQEVFAYLERPAWMDQD